MADPELDDGGITHGVGEDAPSLIPSCCTLDGFALESSGPESVDIESLESGTTLVVQTLYSCYRIVVIDGPRHLVLVRGGKKFPDAVCVRLEGATAGGSAIRRGWIVPGLQIEMRLGQSLIRSSRVRSVMEDSPSRPRARVA